MSVSNFYMASENWNLLTHWASGFQNFVPALVSFLDIGHQYPPPQTPYIRSCNNSSTTSKSHSKSRIQPNANVFRRNASIDKQFHLISKLRFSSKVHFKVHFSAWLCYSLSILLWTVSSLALVVNKLVVAILLFQSATNPKSFSFNKIFYFP